MVLRNMRYSKLEISLRCHFCVMLAALNDEIKHKIKMKINWTKVM